MARSAAPQTAAFLPMSPHASEHAVRRRSGDLCHAEPYEVMDLLTRTATLYVTRALRLTPSPASA